VSNVADSPDRARSLRRGVLFGLVAGVVSGVVWYLVVLGTSSTQAYLIPAFGVVVAYGVYRGARRPGLHSAIASVLLTALALIFATFYVERHLLQNYFHENRDAIHIPLVPYLDWVRSVVSHALHKSPSPPLYSVIALIVAGWFGHQGFESHDPARRG